MVIPILTNISRSKGNQATKFGQSIEYMNFFFLEKLYTRCGGETIPRPFPKNHKYWVYLGSFWVYLGPKVLSNLFLYAKLTIAVYWNYAADYFLFPHIKKNKKRYGTSLPASFYERFLNKNVPVLLLEQFSLRGCFLQREILGNIYIVIVC